MYRTEAEKVGQARTLWWNESLDGGRSAVDGGVVKIVPTILYRYVLNQSYGRIHF